MDRVPVVLNGQTVGDLTAAKEGLYVRCQARCRLEPGTLARLYAVGKTGEARLGIPEPRNGAFCLDRRVAARELAPAGFLLRGEVRPVGAPEEDTGGWQPVSDPERLFRGDFLRRELRGCQGVLTRTGDGVRYVALPFDCRRPFLLTGLFCFARVRRIGGRDYAVFAFDRWEMPVFR